MQTVVSIYPYAIRCVPFKAFDWPAHNSGMDWGIHAFAYHLLNSLSTANFLDPFEFDPARFLGDQKYSSYRLDAAEPFSVGPRNCIGRKYIYIHSWSLNSDVDLLTLISLTYAQSRLILANIIYSFDMRLAKDSEGWMNQKHNILWNKPPLNVYLTPVER